MFWSKTQSLKLLLPVLVAAGVLAVGLNGQAHAKSKRGWLGVGIREMTPSLRDEYELGSRDGLLIIDVAPDSPAEDAGLREDDVILKFNGHDVARAKEFSKMVRNMEPGTEVELLILRNGKERE
ncbi:MAG: PDZ domain-containing protein, partial [Calditrichaeota bacterium]